MSDDDDEMESHSIGPGEATLDVEELACRLAEVATGYVRPEGKTATEALDMAEASCHSHGLAFSFREQAHAAIGYVLEALKGGQFGRLN